MKVLIVQNMRKTMNELTNKIACENNDWQCNNCKYKFPSNIHKCFVCGSTDIIFNKIRQKTKKTNIKGATLKINL